MKMRKQKTAMMRARGFSLIGAVFLLVALGGLAAAMVQFSSMQHESSALDIQGAQAYQAARAGIEWGLYQQLQPVPAPAGCFNPNPSSFSLPAGSALAGFSVTVTCVVTSDAIAAGVVVNRKQITAVACNLPAAGLCPNPGRPQHYVQRTIQVDI